MNKQRRKITTISSKPLTFKTLKALKAYLTRKRIKWRSWKTLRTKTVGHLFELLRKKLAEIHEDDGKPLLFAVDVGVDVVCRLTEDTLQILVEKQRVFEDKRRPDQRKTRHSLKGEIEPGQTAAEAAYNIIVKVLKFSRNRFVIVNRMTAEPYFKAVDRIHHEGSKYRNHYLLIELDAYELNPEIDPVESFPGLESRRARRVVLCIVPRKAYRHGHEHESGGKRTFFEYVLLRDVSRYDPHYTVDKYKPLSRHE